MFRVLGVKFRVSSLCFRAWDLESRVSGYGFRVYILEFKVENSWCMEKGLGFSGYE